MKRDVIVLLIVALFVIPFASAEIFISQPASAYNYGDVLNSTISLVPQIDTNGFLSVALVCDTLEAELHKSSYTVANGEKKIVYLLANLDSAIISDLQGNCFLRAKYGNEEKASQYFIVTKNIDVIANVEGSFVTPGNNFKISGKATKTNGNALKGFIEASSPELNLQANQVVTNGNFKINLTVSDKAKAGSYTVTINAYEKDSSGAVTNLGTTSVGIVVRSVPEKADVAFSEPSVKPGNDFSYTGVLLDQSGESLADDVSVSLYLPDGALFSKTIAIAGQAQVIHIEKDFAPGNWKVVVEQASLKAEKTFYVEELMEASFVLVNGTLAVNNIGNVAYTKPVEISIGEAVEIEELNIPVGEYKKFLLYAPDGSYSIKVKNGDINQELGSSLLTGNVIAVKEDGLVLAGKTTLMLWIFIIALVGVFAFVKYKRVARGSFVGTTPAMMKIGKVNDKVLPVSSLAPPLRFTESPSSGDREECAIVSLKIKNYESIKNGEGPAPETISKIMQAARGMKARVQASEGINSAVFAPSLTKSENVVVSAATFAKEAEAIIQEHNRKYGQKIDFGIGIHKGEMIIEQDAGGIKLTSVGNGSIVARKMADLSDSNVLVSPEAYRKGMNVLKAEKLSDKGAYKINSILNRDSHKKFISGFMGRQ